MATKLGFRNVYFSPAEAAWAGRCRWQLGSHSVHQSTQSASLETVAACSRSTQSGRRPPTRFPWSTSASSMRSTLLKELWVNFVGGSLDTTKFVGLDFNQPPVDVATIAKGLGAKTLHIDGLADLDAVMDEALAYQGQHS